MSDLTETNQTPAAEVQDVTDGSASLALADTALKRGEDVMHDLLATARVDAVYSEPVAHGENLVIPAAEVFSVAGYGSGVGSSERDAGGGGGGGGRTFARPVAVVISTPNGVRVEPVMDVTKVSLAFFTMLGFMVSLAARMRKNKIED